MIETLVKEIRETKQFVLDYQGLVEQRMTQTLRQAGAYPEPDGNSVDRLIQSAGILSLSSDPAARREAFTIATAAFELYGEAMGGLADALRLVMSRLGNFPSLDFRGTLSDQASQLPIPVLFEVTSRRLQNTVVTGGGDLSLTDYQRLIWSDLTANHSIISSAPTSAGKSFMFQTHVAEMLGQNKIVHAAFIVPTRALIAQVAASFSRLLSKFANIETRVLTVPLAQSGEPLPSVYVMTQERLQVLLLQPDFCVDVIVVDEAHLIGDGDRGIILQSVVEELVARNPETQLLFTLPRVKNPLELARIFQIANPRVRKTDDSPVGQNIILLDVMASSPDQVRARLWDMTPQPWDLLIDIDMSLVQKDQKLVYLSWFFGRGAQSIIYGDSQARCEKLALLLCDVIGDSTVTQHAAQRAELAQFIQDHVHKDFVLAKTVLKGVAFHYGHIPTLVRRAIEDAFEAGVLNFIVCTSTLLQGVNLPARNIFMHMPEKGDDRPLEAVDFWNLAGRAGRLGKEFEGNVFLVDYAEWKYHPLEQMQQGQVQSSMEQQVVGNGTALLAYIANTSAESGRDSALENTFSRLFRDFRLEKLDNTLDRLTVPVEHQDALRTAIAKAAATISVPTATLAANPYISPYRQDRLYKKLVRDLPKKGVDYYMPPHPAGDWVKTQSRLINVYRRLQVELDGQPKGEMYKRWATLSLQWMRGRGLPELIQFAIDRDVSRVAAGQADGKNVRRRDRSTIIRELLKDVERDLRFKFVKQMGCYNSVLRQVLLETGNSRAAEHIPPIPLFLEVGASSGTMLSFIDLGLSRISARLLQSRAADFDMNRDTALAWLLQQDFTGASVPDVVVRDLEPLLRKA